MHIYIFLVRHNTLNIQLAMSDGDRNGQDMSCCANVHRPELLFSGFLHTDVVGGVMDHKKALDTVIVAH